MPRMKRKKKKKKKKVTMALMSLPKKEARKEVKMTVLLIVMAVSHGLLTMPGNVAYLCYTNFPEAWSNFQGR